MLIVGWWKHLSCCLREAKDREARNKDDAALKAAYALYLAGDGGAGEDCCP